MRISLLAVLAVCLTVMGCKSADNNVPAIASDFCNCFSSLDAKMSSDAKVFLKKASETADPETYMATEIEKMDSDKQLSVGTGMMAMAEINEQGSVVQKCMKAVEEKYKSHLTLNENAFIKKIITELETKKDCGLTATILRMGLKVKE